LLLFVIGFAVLNGGCGSGLVDDYVSDYEDEYEDDWHEYYGDVDVSNFNGTWVFDPTYTGQYTSTNIADINLVIYGVDGDLSGFTASISGSFKRTQDGPTETFNAINIQFVNLYPNEYLEYEGYNNQYHAPNHQSQAYLHIGTIKTSSLFEYTTDSGFRIVCRMDRM
jgi:hypothetical protein